MLNSRVRSLLAVLFVFVVGASLGAQPVLASGGGGEKKEGKPEVFEGVELLNVPLPVSRNGRLINYLYVSTKITPAPKRDGGKMKESAHFLRDAVIIAAHRADFSDPTNPEKIDAKRMTALITAEATRIFGAGSVGKVEITGVDSKRIGIAKRYAPTAPQPKSANAAPILQ